MSLRQKVGAWASTLLSIMVTRVELFALEASEEKNELMKMLVWVGGAMFFAALAFIVLTLLVILLFWPTQWRYWAFAVVILVYAGLGIYFARKLIRRLFYGPLPFQATLEELRKDLQLVQQLYDKDEPSASPADAQAPNDGVDITTRNK
ncbi:MAG TPA: phage holin family protein [Paenalcaligenes sp.]|nr:phage holin family protein [Paenalcaligenes sp.]